MSCINTYRKNLYIHHLNQAWECFTTASKEIPLSPFPNKNASTTLDKINTQLEKFKELTTTTLKNLTKASSSPLLSSLDLAVSSDNPIQNLSKSVQKLSLTSTLDATSRLFSSLNLDIPNNISHIIKTHPKMTQEAFSYAIDPLTLLKNQRELEASIFCVEQPFLFDAEIKLPCDTLKFIRNTYLSYPIQQETSAKPLGHGMYGDVVLISGHGENFACKHPKKETGKRSLEREACFYMLLNHPNILTIQAIRAHNLYLPYLREGSFERRILSPNLTPSKIQSYFIQLAKAVTYIHGQGLTWRDLKSDNLLASDDKAQIQLCDLGNMTFSKNDRYQGGTPYYMAPEIHQVSKRNPITNKVDSWSFGVLLYKTITKGNLPFPNPAPQELVENYLKRISLTQFKKPCPETIFDHLDDAALTSLKKRDPKHFYRNLILKCLHGDPDKRPSMQELQNFLESPEKFHNGS